jgi:hypothetical protein
MKKTRYLLPIITIFCSILTLCLFVYIFGQIIFEYEINKLFIIPLFIMAIINIYLFSNLRQKYQSHKE